MDRNYLGEPNLRIERSTSVSSSKKEKKSNNTNKPKQPRRGLGVAQLEKIRLQTQLGYGTFYPYNLNQMDRNYLGEPNLRIERSTSVSSSKKEKKSNNTNKPKQPRRGLGVAQLEKIRLQTQLGYGTFYPYNLNQMGLRRLKIENIGNDNSQSSITLRWSPTKEIIDSQQFPDSRVPRQFLIQVAEEEQTRRKRNEMMSSGDQKLKKSDYEELDLELRLSI